MDFLNNISYNSRYSDSIKLSKYTQTIENVINNICDTSNSYKTLEESIIYTYDHNTLLNSNTKLYIDQYKLKLATDIDEKSKDLYETGTIGNILQLLKLPDGTVKVLIEGKRRCLINKFTESELFLEAEVNLIEENINEEKNKLEQIEELINIFEQYVKHPF